VQKNPANQCKGKGLGIGCEAEFQLTPNKMPKTLEHPKSPNKGLLSNSSRASVQQIRPGSLQQSRRGKPGPGGQVSTRSLESATQACSRGGRGGSGDRGWREQRWEPEAHHRIQIC
jgi:hypothetical protein